MRIAAFFLVVALFVVGVTTTSIAQPAVAADPTTTPDGAPEKTCSTVFVAGKGVVDSCSNGHKDTARVYPRKAGIPANGCADVCPEVTDAANTRTTPGPADKSTPRAGSSSFATPVPSSFTDPGNPQPTPQNCDRVSYPDICVPPAPPYLSCSDIPDRNFRVRAPDPHRFDADGNGIGCEQVAGPTIGR